MYKVLEIEDRLIKKGKRLKLDDSDISLFYKEE